MSRAAEIYEAVASALASAREPDLSSYGGAEVRAAMADVLVTGAARDGFVAWLESRVQTLSDGQVAVDEPSAGQDPHLVRLRLVVAGEPFAEPVVLHADVDDPLEYPMRGA